jgi:hypothetical protein
MQNLLMQISAEQWPVLSKLLDEVLELPVDARETWFESLPQEHAALKPTLREFLVNHAAAETNDFLHTMPKFSAANSDDDAAGSKLAPGTAVGAYVLEQEIGLSPEASVQVAGFVHEGRRVLGTVPTQKRAVLERFFDESGGMQMVLHAPFGGRINRAWGLALRKRFCRGFGFELQAARLDGCGFGRQYWHVVLPAVRPALGFLGIYTYINAWNDYAWPLIALVDPHKVTLQVALSQLHTAHHTDYSMVMAGTLMAVLPLVVVFILFARQFIRDVMKGALRG